VSSIGEKDKTLYGLLPLLPGILEAQIMWSKFHDEEYGKQFAPLAEDFYKELGDLIRPALEERGKFEVGRVIPVEKTITESARISTIAFPSDIYSEIIERNNSFALIACPCRTNAEYLGNGCGRPIDVCSAMGLVADFVVDKGIAKRASKEEFLDARVRASEAGLVNLVDNLRDPMQICSCCSCCSGALRLLTQHNLPALFADTHFETVVDAEECSGCGQCMEWCQLDAMSLRDEQAVAIDYNRCIGCGVCVSKCDENALSLKQKSNCQPSPDSVVDYGINRYLELKNYDKNGFLPKVGLGMGRLISNLVQPKLTGPKYKPRV
jgi:Pyruvate/2-oxoacid:ferredoxin oxidoreductase delta subunit